MRRKILISGILIVALLSVFAQTPEKKLYNASRISTPPTINGKLDDVSWQSGAWLDDFTQYQPYNGRPASQRTEFNILFDDNFLYVALKAFDNSPDSIVNRLTRRDEADGDLVGIILDSFHDLRTGFLFGVSSAGVKYDRMIMNDGEYEDPSWDPNWWVQTSVNDQGWVAEMKIPFSQVRFDKKSGTVWGLEIGRVLYRKNETAYWQHIPKEAPGIVHLYGEMMGLEEIKPRKIFDVTPYTVARAETFQADPENPFMAEGRSSKISAGVDAKIGITNNMTMDLTVNPDFGQVEADPSEVNLTAYETFFKEKRPFFIEGSNITKFGLGIGDGENGNDNLFYSRRIGRKPQRCLDLEDDWHADIPKQTTILGAVKLTGKTKEGLSVGFVNAVTDDEFAKIDTVGGQIQEAVEPLTNYFLARVQKDVNNGNTLVGGMFTATNRKLNDQTADILHKAAYTGGLDFTRYFKDKSWSLNFQPAVSYVEGSKEAIENTQMSSARYFQRPDKDYAVLDTNRTSLFGTAGRLQIMKLNGHWNFMSVNIWKTPGFETNDIGYLREADKFLSVLWAQYKQWEPKGIYRSYNISSDIYLVRNFGGDNLGKGYEWNARMEMKNFWNVNAGGAIRGENLDQAILRGGPMMKTPGNFSIQCGFSSDSRKKLLFNVHANINSGMEESSIYKHAEFEITYKPINYLVFSLNPEFTVSSNTLQYVTMENYNKGDKYVFASIDRETVSASFRVNLNLSPNLSLQYWGQPFFASGKYYEHKQITNPIAAKYTDRYQTYTPDQISLVGDQYEVDEDMDGTTDYGFDNKDFNKGEFLSNLVLRWEYNPGSSIYLVWSQTRSSSENTGNLDLGNDMNVLFDSSENKPYNVFLIKLSYRFGLR